MAYTLIETGSDQEFVAQATERMALSIAGAIETRGRAIVGLSGGSTPRAVYGTLGENTAIDWSKVWIFLVDDRYVREDSPHSNQFLLRSTLLRHAPIPESQLILPDTELTIAECVGLYEEHMRDLLRKGPPDLVTLGLGDDGHTASLFPPVPDEAFGQRLAIHTKTDRFDIPDRISTTMAVLKPAGTHLLFLKGAAKKTALDQSLSIANDPKRFPLQAILDEGRTTVVAQW